MHSNCGIRTRHDFGCVLHQAKYLPNLNERISNVQKTIEQNLEYSFDVQRGIADFEGGSDRMNRLAKESEFYQNTLKSLKEL